jgi:hypothetical protein
MNEDQIYYLQEVLGVKNVLMPILPVPIADVSQVTHDQNIVDQSLGNQNIGEQGAVSPIEAARFQIYESDDKPKMICLAASADDHPIFQGESDSLAEKMILAMKLSSNQVTWIEWVNSAESCPSVILDRVLSSHVPILVFGVDAARSLLGAPALVGQWVEWSGVKLMVTYSLSQLLLEPNLKKEAWAHLQSIMKILK